MTTVPELNELNELWERLGHDRATSIGFPGAVDLDVSELLPFFTIPLNNVGDPFVDGAGRTHTKALEREVVGFFADLFRARRDDRWGYVTTGGSEGNLYALQVARGLLPRAVVYYSDAAHYSVEKAVRLLGMDAVRVRADRWGEIEYDDLTAQLERRRDRPAAVVATIGTTMTEAVDDVRRIVAILDTLAVRDRFVHADAALSGLPLALLEPAARPGFDLADGADSVAVSGHKFLGVPLPCGVVVVRESHRHRVARTVSYTGTPDATVGGSRSGHAPLLLWYAIRRHGIPGLRERADRAREVAAHAKKLLDALGWIAFRHEHAFTVVLRTPPEPLLRKWVLATSDGWSHLVAMPGVTMDTIDAFVADLQHETTTGR